MTTSDFSHYLSTYMFYLGIFLAFFSNLFIQVSFLKYPKWVSENLTPLFVLSLIAIILITTFAIALLVFFGVKMFEKEKKNEQKHS